MGYHNKDGGNSIIAITIIMRKGYIQTGEGEEGSHGQPQPQQAQKQQEQPPLQHQEHDQEIGTRTTQRLDIIMETQYLLNNNTISVK